MRKRLPTKRSQRRQHSVGRGEQLEDRRLLAHVGFGESITDYDGSDPAMQQEWQISKSNRFNSEIHQLHNEQFEFTWEPEASIEANETNALNTWNSVLVGAEQEPDAGEPPAAGALNSLDSIPILHSNPGAKATLYLDFDGHYEATWGAFNNALTPVWDIDGDATTYSDAELTMIQEIWARSSEDYAPFDIDVTTEEPAILSDGTPDEDANGKALRVAFGGKSEDWLGRSAGGFSYMNSFTSSIPNVAYVFASSNSIWNGDAASHEAGHAFGLQHQSRYDESGVKTQEYYYESGNWSPIMGTHHYVSIWHNGTSSLGSSIYQDDMAVLASPTNGFGYRSDDHSDTIASATPLSINGNTWSGEGIIETNNDIDLFSFTVAAEDTFEIRADLIAAHNLDVVLSLYDSSGTLITTVNPVDSESASFVQVLTPGDYFVAITKPSTYGWVGTYTVNVNKLPAGISVSSESTTLLTGESGISTTFDVVLDTKPTHNVVVHVSSSDPTEGTASVSSLTFTPGNWDVPQKVTVTGVDDSESDGLGFYHIILGSTTSTDPEYQGLAPVNVAVSNLDNDVPGWAFQLSGSDTVWTYDVAVGPDGNIYITGRFKGTADFDPGVGTELRSSKDPGKYDSFVAKYTPDGDLQWVQSYGGAGGNEHTYQLEFDHAGNLIIAGNFSSPTATFGAFTLTRNGDSSGDAFAAKLDANGTFLWARSWGGDGSDSAKSLSVSSDGTIHIVGTYNLTVDFNPGAGTFELTSQGRSDGYLLNLNSDGEFLSATSFGGTATDIVHLIASDNDGNTYIVGYFKETATFGSNNGVPVTLTSTSGSDGFLMKVSSTGNTEWVLQVNGTDTVGALRVGFDGIGGVYFTGFFWETIDFGAGNPTFTSAGSVDTFITKWDTSGNLTWSGQIEGVDTSRVLDMQFDGSGNATFLAYFEESVDLRFGSATKTLTTGQSGRDMVIFQLASSDGSVGRVDQVVRGNTTTFAYSSIALDDAGNLYMSSYFKDTSILFPTGDILTSDDTYDSVLMKMIIAPGVSVSPVSSSVTSEAGGSASFSVVLDTIPTADVTISLSSTDTSEGTVSPSSLTFTPANWNVAQTYTVQGVDDGAPDGDVEYAILATPTSADLRYNGLDAVNVTVTNTDDEEPVIHELLNDSFEVGEWNGVWVEDIQNDWERSTQRKSHGSHSAEVDGSANNATLTLANAINLTNYRTAELTFSWYIESGFNTNEYIALDFFDGSNWTEVAALKGNVDQENTWHHETITIDGDNLVDNFKIRYRSKVNSSLGDGFVDNVKIMGTLGVFNAAPEASNDSGYSVNEDDILTVTAAGILTNDTDAEGDPLSAILVSAPANGTLNLNANGSFSYTPNADFNGPDSFTYVANDGSSNSNTATVSITVNSVDDAPVATDDAYNVAEDGVLSVPVSGVLSNDSDVDGDSLTVSLVSDTTKGVLVLNANGSFGYTPAANFFGTDSFTYEVSDGQGGTAQATATITVSSVNDVPVSVADSATTDEDTAVMIDVLSNDSDIEGNALSAVLVSGPANGSLVLNGDKTFTYTPNANFNGSDSFTYVANDSSGNSNTSTVSITVNSINDVPVASGEAYNIAEDGVLTVPVTGVLSNDTDADGDSLSVSLVSDTTKGLLVLNANGSFGYTPAANFFGNDSFIYEVSDGQGSTSQATATITVSAVNDVPVSVADSATTDEDNAIVINVLSNDTDVEGDALSAVLVSGPAHGSLVLNGDNTFTYTPNANFNGTDSFTYVANDGSGNSNAATASITVNSINDVPVAANENYNVAEDGVLTVPTSGVLSNDSDADGDALTVSLASDTTKGLLALNADGSFNYTPSANFFGTDSFTYEVSDGQGGTAQATVSITVSSVNDVPVSVDDSATTDEDIVIVINVLSNDTDVERDALSVVLVSGPDNGSLVLNGDNTFTYTPNLNFYGSDSFTYMANDGSGNSNTSTVSITVNSVNDAPVASGENYTINQNTVLNVTADGVLTNDSDVDGDSLSVSLISDTMNGLLALNANGSFDYAPAENFFGSDSFAYEVSDGQGGTAQATATITVVSVDMVLFDIALVEAPTTTAADGSVGTVPDSMTIVHEWQNYYLEVYAKLSHEISYRLTNVQFTLNYDETVGNLDLNNIIAGGGLDSFNVTPATNQLDVSATISNANPSLGVDSPFLIARIPASSSVVANVLGDYPAEGSTNLPTMTHSQVGLDQVPVDVPGTNAANPGTSIQAVRYDINDNDRVDLPDLSMLVNAFGQATTNSDLAFRSDFDKNGSVGLSDLARLVNHFGYSQGDSNTIVFPIEVAPEPVIVLLEEEPVVDENLASIYVGQAVPDVMAEPVFSSRHAQPDLREIAFATIPLVEPKSIVSEEKMGTNLAPLATPLELDALWSAKDELLRIDDRLLELVTTGDNHSSVQLSKQNKEDQTDDLFAHWGI